ncbi:MAG: response regulator [Deltaproteobacteria bacterium]|nr:response regulator [Deltaproteobacteria bacterium]
MTESVLRNKRLLAVDDEPDILDTLEESLEGIEGLSLDRATDYESGYHLLRSWTYDLVILDIMGVRGFDLLNASVSLGFPTVMLTAHALTLDALEKSVDMGARAFLPKEKLAEITPFLEDVLTLSYPSAWQRLFDRLGGFFSASFGPAWQIRERKFREHLAEGKPMRDPAILKK